MRWSDSGTCLGVHPGPDAHRHTAANHHVASVGELSGLKFSGCDERRECMAWLVGARTDDHGYARAIDRSVGARLDTRALAPTLALVLHLAHKRAGPG